MEAFSQVVQEEAFSRVAQTVQAFSQVVHWVEAFLAMEAFHGRHWMPFTQVVRRRTWHKKVRCFAMTAFV